MPKQRREPVRTCVACRQQGSKRTMVRVVRTPEGAVIVDRPGRASGRGAYLHVTSACIELARKRRNLERALRAHVGPEVWAALA